MNFSYYWPIGLIVLSNIFYHICSKQMPGTVHPLAALTVTYGVGAVASGVLYCLLNRGGSLLAEYRNLGWPAFVLGLAIVGLEAGSIYMYKAGWTLNSGHLVHGTILAIALIFLGYFLYHEPITWTKLGGVVLCLAGLALVNR